MFSQHNGQQGNASLQLPGTQAIARESKMSRNKRALGNFKRFIYNFLNDTTHKILINKQQTVRKIKVLGYKNVA